MIFSKKYRISIDTPCLEKWEGMTAMGKGRFCDSCSKNVIDFSVMSEKEIVAFFKNKPLNTCGRFTKEQMEKTYIQKPELKLPYHQRFFSFLFSLFVSNSFISKANAQSDSIWVVRNDSLQKPANVDAVFTDSISIAEVDPTCLPDSTIADSLFTTTMNPDIITDPQEIVVDYPICTVGVITLSPPLQPEQNFLNSWLRSIGIVENDEAVNTKGEAVSQNDDSFPKKEPVKKDFVISDAVLPEELKRKINKN